MKKHEGNPREQTHIRKTYPKIASKRRPGSDKVTA